jgi:hypothetical protein
MELTLMAMVLVDNIHQGIWRTLRITQPIIKNSSSTSSKMVATKKNQQQYLRHTLWCLYYRWSH